MITGLEHLLAEGILSEVLARLKSGKEADVYVVRYGGKIVAAKVYKERAHRSFKNNADYKEGRAVRSSRSQRAMDRKTSFGKAASEDAWKAAEADALYKLHAAGVRVPAPVVFLEGILVMELLLDEHGDAAPRLIDKDLSVDDAKRAYHDMLGQLVRMLTCDLIHGDLSPYNVLWAASGPTIIDFPQVISAAHNSRSEAFFLRDARNILGHFASIDRSLHARSGDPAEIWRAYVRREISPDFLPVGRHEPVRRPQLPPRHVAPQAAPRGTHPRDARPQHAPQNRGPHAHTSHGPRRPPHAPEVIVHARRGAQPAQTAPQAERHGMTHDAEATASPRPGRRRRRRR